MTSASRRRVRFHRPSGRGFTLLEVLLATVLVATLLLAMWSLLSTYVALFEKGQAKTDHSQLVRSLSRQLNDDLAGAIQDPLAGSPETRSGPTAARRFGLYGTSNFLRVDVLQVAPFADVGLEEGETAERSGRAPSGKVPELRTVFYTFVEPGGTSQMDPEARPGLTRRELDFETPPDEIGRTTGRTISRTGSAAGSDSPLGPSAGGAEDRSLFDEVASASADQTTLWAPEVVGLQFRYFDGRSWTSQWSSLDRKGLPVAVEVTMQVASFKKAEEIHRSAISNQQSAISDQQSAISNQQSAISDLPAHRVVVHLAGSPLHRPAPRASSTVERIKRRTAPRPRRPARITPPSAKPSRPLNAPDEWMRNQK